MTALEIVFCLVMIPLFMAGVAVGVLLALWHFGAFTRDQTTIARFEQARSVLRR